MRKKIEAKAHEVTTVLSFNGVARKIMEKYIVIAPTTSKAISMITLRDGEEILRAEELNHKLVMGGRK